jgi:hypothetical protein
VLCVLCPKTLQGADIAFDTEGHISLVAAAIPYMSLVSKGPIPPLSLFNGGILTGSAETWKAMAVVNLPDPNLSSPPTPSGTFGWIAYAEIDMKCSKECLRVIDAPQAEECRCQQDQTR